MANALAVQFVDAQMIFSAGGSGGYFAQVELRQLMSNISVV